MDSTGRAGEAEKSADSSSIKDLLRKFGRAGKESILWALR